MKDLSKCINEIISSLGEEGAKIASAASNGKIYVKAVKGIWKDKAASDLILEHTNAFYIRKDGSVRLKGSALKDDPKLASGYVVCEICVDDSMVMSELDTHKELLAFALRTNGLAFEELRLIHAKGNMRKRHPFKENAESMPK